MLADLALEWDAAAAVGEESFARQVAAGERAVVDDGRLAKWRRVGWGTRQCTTTRLVPAGRATSPRSPVGPGSRSGSRPAPLSAVARSPRTWLMFEGVPNYPTNSRFWEVIDKHKVNTFYTAPTAIRALMKAGDGPAKKTSRRFR